MDKVLIGFLIGLISGIGILSIKMPKYSDVCNYCEEGLSLSDCKDVIEFRKMEEKYNNLEKRRRND